MNQERVWDHKLRNLLHSTLLLTAMLGLLAWIGGLIFDTPGVTLALVAGMALFTLGRVSPHWVLRMHRARALAVHQAPDLYQIVGQLARRADLRAVPRLYLVPSPALNAFAVGNAGESAIGVTRGLLASLSHRELAGVLAHEISHIRHHDLWVMGLARLIGSLTRGLSTLGQVMLLLSLPTLVLGGYHLPWAALLLLLAAPSLSSLLFLALSRTRELEADLGAARLTGDPMGLASALARLEARQGGWWRALFPMRRRASSSFLDSHPATAERIARLRSLVDHSAAPRRHTTPGIVRPTARQAPVRQVRQVPVRQVPVRQIPVRRIPVRLVDHGSVPWPASPRQVVQLTTSSRQLPNSAIC